MTNGKATLCRPTEQLARFATYSDRSAANADSYPCSDSEAVSSTVDYLRQTLSSKNPAKRRALSSPSTVYFAHQQAVSDATCRGQIWVDATV